MEYKRIHSKITIWKAGDNLIQVIGKESCSRCEMVKTMLINKKIDFSYTTLDELEDDLKKVYLKEARTKGLMNLPLIIKDNTVIDLKEAIN